MRALAASRLPIGGTSRPWLPRTAPSRAYSTGTSPTQTSRPAPLRESKALRTAEARESALRAARLRRQGETLERQVEAAKRAVEKQKYERRYKAAGRRWVSAMIALPVALVTSYYLFDRLVLGHEQKERPRFKDRESDDQE